MPGRPWVSFSAGYITMCGSGDFLPHLPLVGRVRRNK
jgi:hypothetical protein